MIIKREELLTARLRAEEKADHERAIEAHEKLESFVRDERLYYAMPQTKKVYYEDSRTRPMADYAYHFTVGVSPHSGNPVSPLRSAARS